MEKRIRALESSSSFVEIAEAVLADQQNLRRDFGFLKLKIAFAVMDALLLRSPVGIGALQSRAMEVLGRSCCDDVMSISAEPAQADSNELIDEPPQESTTGASMDVD